jgi:hypothetical protein
VANNKLIDDEETPQEPSRSFNAFFARLADEEAHGEASAELHGLLAHLRSLSRMANGPKTGTLTITIKVSVEADIVDIGYDVTAKKPKPPRKKDRAWLSRGDNIVYEDPRQMSLKGVRGVPQTKREVRDVEGEDLAARDS